jgi:hypothetical protein
MTHELCRFTLIFPNWLPWLLSAIGILLLAPGALRLAGSNYMNEFDFGGKRVKIGNSVVLFLTGFVCLCAGIAGLGANYHQPFARWVGGTVTALISEQDPMVKADLNDELLGDLASKLSRTDLYTVRISSAASKTMVNGTYRDAFCGADLVNRICQNEASKLTCDIDPTAKVVRVCTKADAVECKNRNL